MESRSRRSCGRVLVGSDAARSVLELAGVSSQRRLRCGSASGARERERGNGRVHFARGVAVEDMRASGADERARDGVRAPNVAVVLTPVGHVDELGVH